jgi:hypothetical protein
MVFQNRKGEIEIDSANDAASHSTLVFAEARIYSATGILFLKLLTTTMTE